MTLDTQTWMMIFFIPLVAVSFYKIRQFLPQEQLHDDDTTPEAQDKLEAIAIRVINENENIDEIQLYENIKNDVNFDKEHFWRFNQNKSNQLLNTLRAKGLVSI